jgi:urease accessory protein
MKDAGLLSLIQWLSPAFPTGAYAYSHGLEQAMATGDVTGAESAAQWIADVLEYGSGRTDAILLARGMDEGADLDALSALARALAASRERLDETLEQGTAFAATVAALTGAPQPPRPLPLAVAAAARGIGLPARQVVAVYLHAFAANLVSAAVRFMPLGQTAGQAALAGLHPLILRLAGVAALAPLAAIGQSAFRADLAAMRHETLDVRIFKT